MNAFLKIAALSVAAAAIGVSAQAADHASQEVYGPAMPAQVVMPTRAATLSDSSRAAVKAEQARAWAAGELDFAYQEAYAFPLNRGTATPSELRMAARHGATTSK